MNAPGKGLLKVVSILFIVFGAIATVVSVLGLVGAVWISSAVSDVGMMLMVAMIILLFGSLLELVLGIVGLKKCGDSSKAKYFIITGIILCLIMLVSVILNFQITNLVGFVLPILYIVGGIMNNRIPTDISPSA